MAKYIGEETPSKKRKFIGDTDETGKKPKLSFAAVADVQPLSAQQQQQHGMDILKNMMMKKNQLQVQQKPKPQGNICFGTAKPDGCSGSGSEILAADVSLVASGV